MAAHDGTIKINTQVDTSGIKSGTNQIEKMMDRVKSAAVKVGKAIAAAFAIRQIVAFSRECIELGSDLEEVQNVVDVTFGAMSGAIEKFSHEAATQFGLSELSAKQYTSTIGAMFKSMGFTGDAVTDMSIKMAQLTGDMASFYNLDTDTAFQKIRAGISGETEPLKQLGINLSEANLEQFRLNQGMTTAYNQMNQQQKALLRYNYLLSVTSDAQGDFARTSNSWANQTRILKLQFDSIKASIGQGLINVFTPVLRMINLVLQGVAKLASAFKAFTQLITGSKGAASTSTGASPGAGISDMADNYTDAAAAADDYADATEGTAKATKAAAKENRKFLSGLDEIHRFETDSTVDTGGGSSPGKSGKTSVPAAADIGSAMASMDFGTLAEGETVLDKTAEKMKAFYDTVMTGLQPTIDAFKRLWSEGLSQLGQFTWQALKDFYTGFLVPVASWTFGEGIPRLVNALNNGLMAVDWGRINGGLQNLWAALAPFAIRVGSGLVWFWENALVPLGTWVMNEAVPRFLTLATNAISAFDAVLAALQPEFEWFWNQVLTPIAQWVADKFTAGWDLINDKLRQFTTWAKENPETVATIAEAVAGFFAAWKISSLLLQIPLLISAIGGIVTSINPVIAVAALLVAAGIAIYKNWETIKAKAQEIWKFLGEWLRKKWENIKAEAWLKFEAIKTKIENIWETIKTNAGQVWSFLTKTLRETWEGIKKTAIEKWEALKDKVVGFVETLKSDVVDKVQAIRETLERKWNIIKSLAGTAWENIKEKVVGKVKDLKDKVIEFGEGIRDGFVDAFEGIKSLIKTPINAVIRFINRLIKGVVLGINNVIDTLNTLNFSIPDWVPYYGGSSFGLRIPRISSYPIIPELATGAVIPPHAPFLAMLGDQKNGTNLEMPESLLRQVIREELGSGGREYRFVGQINRRTLFDEFIEEAKLRRDQSGLNPLEI